MHTVLARLRSHFPYSPHQFAVWRILFGGYLLFYTLTLLPYGSILYSSAGIYAEPPLPLFWGNVAALSRSPEMITAILLVMAISATAVLVGYYRRIAAFLLWYLSACLFNLNPLTEDPSMAYVGLLLVLLALIPSGEPLSLDRRRCEQPVNWHMPWPAYMIALIALGVGYSLSGFDKLHAFGFWHGDAFGYMLQLAIAHDTWLRAVLLAQPAWLLAIETWLAAGSMLLALPLLLWRKTRFFIWCVLFFSFVLVHVLFDLAQVTLGMLLFKLFLFDYRWIPSARARTRSVLYFDTTCNLCQAYTRFSKAEDSLQQLAYESIYSHPRTNEREPGSIILATDTGELTKSEAVITHWRVLGGWWRLAAEIGRWLPRRWRDYLYDIVGHNRYRWFGRYTATTARPHSEREQE